MDIKKYTKKFFIGRKRRYHLVVSTRHFYWVTLLIVLLPLSSKWELLVYGQVTEGVVVRHVYAVGKDAFEGGSVFSVINYSIGERAFDFYAGENVIIPLHEKVRVIYNTRDVEDCRVYSLKGLYLGDNLILPLVLLIFWIAVYLSLPKKK